MGNAAAHLLYNEGYSLALVDISQEKLDAVVKELEASSGKGKAVGIATDVSDLAAVEKLVEETVQKYGKLYGVGHFAGIASLLSTSKFCVNDSG